MNSLINRLYEGEEAKPLLDEADSRIEALEKQNAEMLAAQKVILSATAELAKEINGMSNDVMHETLMQQVRRIAQALTKPSTNQEVSK